MDVEALFPWIWAVIVLGVMIAQFVVAFRSGMWAGLRFYPIGVAIIIVTPFIVPGATGGWSSFRVALGMLMIVSSPLFALAVVVMLIALAARMARRWWASRKPPR